jgi:Ion channel
MDYTLEFLKIFFIALWYSVPIIVFLVTLIIILGHVIGIREGWSRSDSVYYAFITATTVGYGDFHPRKRLSKTLAIVISFVGVVLTGIIVALALHAAAHAFKSTPHYDQLINKLEKIENTYE